MDRHDQGFEVFAGQVLEFIDQNDDRGVSGFRSLACGDEQIGEIAGQFAAVGRTGLGIDIDGELDIPMLDLDGAGIALENTKPLLDLLADTFGPIEFQQGCAEGSYDADRERFVGACLQKIRQRAILVGYGLNLIEQNGFPTPRSPTKMKLRAVLPSRFR